MKIRSGFVANSSSSSFIVIGNVIHSYNLENEKYSIGQFGKTEFGWEDETTGSVDGKINFAAMQAMYVKNEVWMEMLTNVIKEQFGCSTVENLISFEYPVPDGKVEGYIDHQSSSSEGENTEIFESEEKLKLFLFSPDSFIQGGNDN